MFDQTCQTPRDEENRESSDSWRFEMLVTQWIILIGFVAVALFSAFVCQPVPEARLFDREVGDTL